MSTSIVSPSQGRTPMAAPLALALAIAFVVLVAFFVAVSMLMSDPQGGDRAIGVCNRLLVLSWAVWVVCLARGAMRR